LRSEFIGDVMAVRTVEDCIRATKKYTKGVFSRPAPRPIQGEDFPSTVVTEYYEVYPDMEVGLDMSIIDAAFWLAGDTLHIDVRFKYNYQRNKAIVVVYGSNGVVDMLNEGIPGFREALEKVHENSSEPLPVSQPR